MAKVAKLVYIAIYLLSLFFIAMKNSESKYIAI